MQRRPRPLGGGCTGQADPTAALVSPVPDLPHTHFAPRFTSIQRCHQEHLGCSRDVIVPLAAGARSVPAEELRKQTGLENGVFTVCICCLPSCACRRAPQGRFSRHSSSERFPQTFTKDSALELSLAPSRSPDYMAVSDSLKVAGLGAEQTQTCVPCGSGAAAPGCRLTDGSSDTHGVTPCGLTALLLLSPSLQKA